MNEATMTLRIISDSHSHEGQLVKPGTVIKGIDAATGAHLISLGAAELVGAESSKTKEG